MSDHTRKRIIEAADRLFYQAGYEHTSFADIAGAVGLSRGNFYYHFKTKDQILEAVIAQRMTATQQLLDQWEAEGSGPEQRILSFIGILIANGDPIMRYGCPVGTLCTELAKLEHGAQASASELFVLFRTWLRRQFELLGFEKESDALAMHVLAMSQGVAVLANALQDEEFVRREVDRLSGWLRSCIERGGWCAT